MNGIICFLLGTGVGSIVAFVIMAVLMAGKEYKDFEENGNKHKNNDK